MIDAHAPIGNVPPDRCAGCAGKKQAPIAAVLSIYSAVEFHSIGSTLALCEECGRDLANAVGFMCIRDGGWSKLEPRKKTPKREASST
jgi:hypothetical protein